MSDKKQDSLEQEFKSPITVKEEEVDLGKLFSVIGNALNKIFKLIGKIIKGIFHFFILILIYLKEHFVKLIIAMLLGGSIGFVLDYLTPDKYTYDMIIEPNYGSVYQISEKIEYYNVLIYEEDSIALSKEFNISYKEANSLVSFDLIPYETKKDQILAYDQFIKTTDTLTQQHFTFRDFVGDGPSEFDSKKYVFRIISEMNNLSLFGDLIIKDIESNTTLLKKKRIALNTLKLDSLAAVNSLKKIDELRELYEKVTLLEVEKESTPSSGTYVDFSKGNEMKNNDITLFNISKDLNGRLIEIEREKETKGEIVNVITPFNPVGTNRGTLANSFMVILASIFGGAVLAFFLIVRLNQYLIHYKNRIL
ncbi:hypothetical protein KH5_08980 [Urechidicola sp. KH5]